MRWVLFLLLVYCIFPQHGCSFSSNSHVVHKGFEPYEIIDDLNELNFSYHTEITRPLRRYFVYYNINFSTAHHYFGKFKSDKFELFGNIYIPYHPKGTVFLIHGYNDHSALMSKIIKMLLQKRLAVALFDLPGHGLSSGDRSSILYFSDYARAMRNFVNKCEHTLPKPFHIIGHSLGCSIIMEDYFYNQSAKMEKIIFLSPLVRPVFWKLSKIAYIITRPILNSIPRKSTQDSSNIDFVEFSKRDPLQGRRIPIKWVTALLNWNSKIEKLNNISKPILVLQGDKDKVIDWKYSLSFLKKRCSILKIKLISDAGHQLHNEREEIVTDVLSHISEYLAGGRIKTNKNQTWGGPVQCEN